MNATRMKTPSPTGTMMHRDPVVQNWHVSSITPSIPPIRTDGVGYPWRWLHCAPPDTNRAVGLTQ